MRKIINIANTKASIAYLSSVKNNRFVPFAIRIINSHIVDLNKRIGKNLFNKDALYINSETLWEIMQPQGNKKSHNIHGLTELDIYESIKEISEPYCVIRGKMNRYTIITSTICHFNKQLFLILEVDAGLIQNFSAKIIKIVTIYPKSQLDAYIARQSKEDILYIKNEHQYRHQ